MATRYQKYITFFLPKEVVNFLLLIAHISPLKQKQSEITIGLTIINEILSKSDFYRKKHMFNETQHHYIPLDSRYLQSRYGNDYNKFIKWLVNNNVIWKDTYYTGKTTYYYLQDISNYDKMICQYQKTYNRAIEDCISSYCLSNNIKIDPYIIDNQYDEFITKNRIYTTWYQIKIPISKENEKFLTHEYLADSVYINNAPKHIKKMGSLFRKELDIHYQGAMAHTIEKYYSDVSQAKTSKEKNTAYLKYTSRISSINAIHNGRNNKSLRFSRNKTNGRLDTNLTNMASDLRRFIVGYENMAYLDLRNSQPVLFNVLLKKYVKNAPIGLLGEIQKYFDLTITGKWYDYLIQLYNIPYAINDDASYQLARNKAKENWMLIAYSKNNSVKHLKKVFKKAFPGINEIIEEIKSKNYNQFAIKLQKIESEIFIDEICKELVEVGIVPYSMHDGLLVPKKQQSKSFEIMSTVLKRHLESAPFIKVE